MLNLSSKLKISKLSLLCFNEVQIIFKQDNLNKNSETKYMYTYLYILVNLNVKLVPEKPSPIILLR